MGCLIGVGLACVLQAQSLTYTETTTVTVVRATVGNANVEIWVSNDNYETLDDQRMTPVPDRAGLVYWRKCDTRTMHCRFALSARGSPTPTFIEVSAPDSSSMAQACARVRIVGDSNLTVDRLRQDHEEATPPKLTREQQRQLGPRVPNPPAER